MVAVYVTKTYIKAMYINYNHPNLFIHYWSSLLY